MNWGNMSKLWKISDKHIELLDVLINFIGPLSNRIALLLLRLLIIDDIFNSTRMCRL